MEIFKQGDVLAFILNQNQFTLKGGYLAPPKDIAEWLIVTALDSIKYILVRII